METFLLIVCGIPLLLLDGLLYYYSPAWLIWKLCGGRRHWRDDESVWRTGLWMFLGFLSWLAVIIGGARLIYWFRH